MSDANGNGHQGSERAGRPALGFTFDLEALQPLIRAVVAETVAEIQRDTAAWPDRLAFDEGEAAALLGLKQHQLRDERQRGRIAASIVVGARVRYARADLLDYLAARRVNEQDAARSRRGIA